jgi:hypothetical protein
LAGTAPDEAPPIHRLSDPRNHLIVKIVSVDLDQHEAEIGVEPGFVERPAADVALAQFAG